MTKITTLSQLNTLESNTMIYAVVVFLVAIFISYLISAMVPYEGGQDKSYVKRRVAFIIVGIVACLSFFLYNDLYVKGYIMNSGFKTMFTKTNLICLGITVGGYFLTGLLLMFLFRNSKYGTILGKRKD